MVAGAWTGVGCLATLVFVTLPFADTFPWIVPVLWTLAFVPSSGTLFVGAGALAGALAARFIDTSMPVRDGEPAQYERSHGLRLAWRIGWQTLMYSTLFAGAGYLLMMLLTFLLNVK